MLGLDPPSCTTLMFPHFDGVASFDSSCPRPSEEVGMARPYPPKFRRRVLDLVAAGRRVADVARDLGVTGRRFTTGGAGPHRSGRAAQSESEEFAELMTARRRI